MFNRLFSFFPRVRRFTPMPISPVKSSCTNKERLAAIEFPSDQIPDEFLCKLSEEIMDNPVSFDNLPDNDRIVDQAWLHKWWEKNPTRGNINPFTQTRLTEKPSLNTELKNRIEAFVVEQEQQYAIKQQLARIEALINPFNMAYTSSARLESVGFPPTQVPNKWIDQLLTDHLMTFPIMLDNQYCLDYNTLVKWWEENPIFFCKNPYTFEWVKKIEFNLPLFDEINQFVLFQEKQYIQQQIRVIEERISALQETKTYQEHLTTASCLNKSVPEEFIAHNFSNRMITHPVILDNEFIVDYAELSAWWKKNPANLYKNFYTGNLIHTINYHEELKLRINAYVESPKTYIEKPRITIYQSTLFASTPKFAVSSQNFYDSSSSQNFCAAKISGIS